MGLKLDIKDAYLKSMDYPEDEGNIDNLAEDISNAIIIFLKKQTFTITELKAEVQVESIKTAAPLYASIGTQVQAQSGIPVQAGAFSGTTISPGQLLGRKHGVLIPKLDLDKSGGQGGLLKARGHAYVGKNPVPDGATHEEDTKVKLLEQNIIGR